MVKFTNNFDACASNGYQALLPIRLGTRLGSQYDTTQCIALRRHQIDACRKATRRYSDPILAFNSCIRLSNKSLKYKICISQINATQGLMSLYELAQPLASSPGSLISACNIKKLGGVWGQS